MGNFLFGFTLYHAHYIFIRATNNFIVYYRQGGRQCCFGNFLFGFTLYHAHYIFIRVTNDFIVYYRQGGRQCCFMSLSALLFDRLWFLSLLSLDCRNCGPYLGIWRQNEFRFFSGRTYTRYRNASISNLPFAVRWIAESSRAIGFPTSQTRTHAGQK